MLLYLWLMAQFLVLTLGVVADPHLPHPPLQILILVLMGAVALAPLVPWLVRTLVRAQSLTPHGPPARSRFVDAPEHRLPGTPGTPGGTLARAPSLAVHALA
ncbi:MAG: hypothetical protein L0K86_20055 [Actinomycetia bacterium]|nr:hypothetical protein [Actinomycetes bacterium]